jgi:beta-glucuronidase
VRGSFISPTPTRKLFSLGGGWNYTLESGETGTVSIPAAADFLGKVNYQRSFEVPASDLDRYQWQLVVFGSNYSTDVFVNSEFINTHFGGYTSYSIPIERNILQPGHENVLRLVVDNTLDGRFTIPLRHLVWGWRNYGGIHRDIALLATPLLFVRDVALSAIPLAPGGAMRITAVPEIEGRLDSLVQRVQTDKKAVVGVQIELLETATGTSVGRSAVQPLQYVENRWTGGKVDLVIKNPRLWSPDTPDLYTFRCQLVLTSGTAVTVIDEYTLPYGLRTLELANGDFLLNGRRLVLRGVTWNEDNPAWGSNFPYEERERDVIMMKMLGANVVRFVHHPPHPVMLDLCDRHGLLAIMDLPVSGAPAAVLTNETYQDAAGVMLREMILRDRYHPSVMAWGLGDEIESSSGAVRPFVESLAQIARSLDTRPVYLPVRLGTVDSISDLVDIAAISIHGYDQKQLKPAIEEWRARFPGRPLIVSRLGTEVEHENRRGYNDPLSQQAQAWFFQQRLALIRTLDLDGTILWAFNDWRGDRPALTVHTDDPWTHQMGLVSERREKRLAYDAVRAIFKGEKAAALPAGTYSPTTPIVYVLAGFVVLIALAYVYNVSRRFRESVNRSLMTSYNFFTDVRDQRFVSLIHTTFLALLVSLATAIVVSSVLFHFRYSLFLDNLLSYLVVSDDVKVFVIRLIWDPLRFILVVSVVILLKLLLVSGIVHGLRTVMKGRVYAYHAYTTTIWSTTPLLAFIPIGMILYRVMEGQMYVVPSLIIIAAFLIWVVSRLFKGISIIYDVYPPKLYAAGLLILAAVFGLLYLYYDLVQSAPMHLSFLYSMVGSGQ